MRRRLLCVAAASGLGDAFLGGPAGGAAARPYHVRVLAKHPIAYWRFAERTGPKAIDRTSHHHDGVYRGGITFDEQGPIRSEPGAAIGLNGSDALVEIPDSVAFSQPASGHGLTVEVWLRPDALQFDGETDQHYVHWLGKGESGAFEWGFRFYSRNSPRPNRISAYIWNPNGNEGAGAYFQDHLQRGSWLHIVATFDPGDADTPGAGVSIYKNGVLRGSPATSPGARYAAFGIRPAHGPAPLRLGTRDGGSFLKGGLAEAAIYPRVLSASEILDNYQGA